MPRAPLPLVLAFPIVSLLTFACSLKIDAPAEGPALEVKPTPKPDPSSTPAPPPGGGPQVEPSRPPPTVPATCASLAASTTADGSFTVTSGTLTAADVFVREDEYALDMLDPNSGAPTGKKTYGRTLSIAFTETHHECAYRANHLVPHDMGENRFELSLSSTVATPPAIGVGTWGTTPDQRVDYAMEGGPR